jgi:hypothetical protein
LTTNKIHSQRYKNSNWRLKEVLKKGSIVWLDGARPDNTCIPLSYPGNMPMQPRRKKGFLKVEKVSVYRKLWVSG